MHRQFRAGQWDHCLDPRLMIPDGDEELRVDRGTTDLEVQAGRVTRQTCGSEESMAGLISLRGMNGALAGRIWVAETLLREGCHAPS